MLKRYSTLGEAQIVRGILMSNDIHASIGEENHAAIAWAYIQALGGVTIWIARKDYEVAKNVITFAVANARKDPKFADGNYDQPTKYRWGPIMLYWLMQTGLLNIISIFLAWAVLTLTPNAWWPAMPPEYVMLGKRIATRYSEITMQAWTKDGAFWLSFFTLTLILFLHLTKRYYRDRAI